MSWNAVLDKFIEIKKAVIETGADIWGYDKEKESCLDYWVSLLGNKEYADLIHYLELNEYEDLLLLRYANYSDILSGEEEVTLDYFWNLYDGFYKECRSVVIDIKKDCLVLVPFRKFRNLNEGDENLIENITERIKNASCVEFSNKLDGSMQAARFYDGKVVMSGSQSLDRTQSWRLADGFRMLMEKEGYQMMLKDHQDKTFIFEYISKRDAHLVKYDVEGLFLIGIRNVNNGKESSYAEVLEMAKKYEIPATEVYKKTLDEVVKDLDSKKSSEAEGFVLNIDGFKVKIKYNDYCGMHKILSKISCINVIIKSIADGTYHDDLEPKIPSAYIGRVKKVAEIVFDFKKNREKEIEDAYKKAPKDDKKVFMLWVDENVDKEIQGYVRCKYLGKSFNVLKKSSGYLKLKDMGVEDYKEAVEES